MVESATGRVKGVGQGTAVVMASLQGDPNVKVGIEVSVVEKPTVVLIKIEPGTPTVILGEKLKLVPSVQMADGQINGNVTWSSSDDTIATVNPTTGELSAVKEGRLTIVAAYTVDPRYKGLAEVLVVKDKAQVPPSPSPTPVVFAPGASALPTTLPSPSPTPSTSTEATPTPTPTPTTASPTTGKINGLVKNAETGVGEPGVTVKASNGASATTGADGTYSLTIPAGSATLTASKSRFETAEDVLSVSVTAGGTSNVGPITVNPLHWFNQVSGVNQTLNDIYAVDAQHAWVAGEGGVLLRTTDGGANWLPAQSAPNTAYNAVHFVSASTGWAAGNGGRIVKSTDGGVTWSTQTSGASYDVEDVYFVDETTGWAVTVAEVLYTTDGGATWNKNTQARGYRIAASDATHAVVGGSSNGLYITTTGGLSWQQGAYISGTSLFEMFSQNEIWYGTYYGDVYKSEDGGLSFIQELDGRYGEVPGFKNFATREIVSRECNRMFFVTPQVGWAVDDSGSIKKY